LFHKAEIGPGPELEASVQEAIADAQQRVVGVVHNAVDAQLNGSDQLVLAWSAEGLRQVTAILRIARDAGRIVVVTGDHGHVIEDGTTLVASGGGDRWRTGGSEGEGEIAIAGGRVLSPEGGRAIVMAWSERIRFAGRHHGYHGGVSPQEVLVPIAVLGAGAPPSGWDAAPPVEPAWWRGASEDVPVPVLGDAQPVRRRYSDARQPELFAAPAAPEGVPRHRDVDSAPWAATLLASDAYKAQHRLAGRGAPPDIQVQALLCAVAVRGGRLSRTGLAQALSLPTLRVGGLVNAARRVLNLDQAQVLAIDGEDVVLDERLLRVQFGLGNDR